MPKIKYNKAYRCIINGEKLSRKAKKHILGKRMSRSKLNRLLKEVKVISSADTMYDRPNIEPYLFCPNCGCQEMVGTGNLSCYPEHWERFHCIRCHYLVGYIDNSPFIHALECEDYDPEF